MTIFQCEWVLVLIPTSSSWLLIISHQTMEIIGNLDTNTFEADTKTPPTNQSEVSWCFLLVGCSWQVPPSSFSRPGLISPRGGFSGRSLKSRSGVKSPYLYSIQTSMEILGRYNWLYNWLYLVDIPVRGWKNHQAYIVITKLLPWLCQLPPLLRHSFTLNACAMEFVPGATTWKGLSAETKARREFLVGRYLFLNDCCGLDMSWCDICAYVYIYIYISICINICMNICMRLHEHDMYEYTFKIFQWRGKGGRS